MLRCIIIDDNTSFLQASGTLLERQGLVVVGLASTGADCLRLTLELKPDVVLLDIDLGPESGFEVGIKLASHQTGVKVIFVSAHQDEEFGDLAAASGGLGFVSKSELSREAIEALAGKCGRHADESA